MQTLLGLLAKPALEQRSSAPFWDDPHISLGMLKAHLDPDTDASSYRLAKMCIRDRPTGSRGRAGLITGVWHRGQRLRLLSSSTPQLTQ